MMLHPAEGVLAPPVPPAAPAAPALVDAGARTAAEACLPLHEVMQTAVQQAQALTGAEAAVIEPADGAGLSWQHPGPRRPGEVRPGRTGRSDEVLAVPLAHGGTTFGVLKVRSSAPAGFDAKDGAILRLIADLLSASLAHARRSEHEAARARELSRRNDALDRFSGHVAHDLNNPIAVMRMAGARLREVVADAPGPAAQEAVELVGMIEREAAHSGRLVNGLLSLARAGRARGVEPFDLGTVVGEAAQGIAGIAVENLCAGATVVADRLAVRQALTNLLSNGGRHAAVDGMAALTVRCEASAGHWRVLVADRGPGVAGSDRRRVFRPFECGGTNRGTDGSGLGLAIVAAMAEAHGGASGYEPRPGGGSVFWFSLARHEDGRGRPRPVR